MRAARRGSGLRSSRFRAVALAPSGALNSAGNGPRSRAMPASTRHPRPHRMRKLRTHRRPRRERRGERPQLGTNERGRAGPGRLQPGGLSPAWFIPRPAVPGAAGKPWARSGPCEARAREAPGSTESTGLLSSSASAGILSIGTDFVLTHPTSLPNDLRHRPWDDPPRILTM